MLYFHKVVKEPDAQGWVSQTVLEQEVLAIVQDHAYPLPPSLFPSLPPSALLCLTLPIYLSPFCTRPLTGSYFPPPFNRWKGRSSIPGRNGNSIDLWPLPAGNQSCCPETELGIAPKCRRIGTRGILEGTVSFTPPTACLE